MANIFDNRCILLADDMKDVRQMLSEMLGSLSRTIKIREAADGEQCLLAIDEHVPDVLVLDLTMPIIDGNTVLDRLRSNDRTRFLPVLVLTAHDHQYVEFGALDSGADEFLGKPISQVKFIGRMRSLLRQRDNIKLLQTRILELEQHPGVAPQEPGRHRGESPPTGDHGRVARVQKLIRTQVEMESTPEAALLFAQQLDGLSRAIVRRMAQRARAGSRQVVDVPEGEVSFSPLLAQLREGLDSRDAACELLASFDIQTCESILRDVLGAKADLNIGKSGKS